MPLSLSRTLLAAAVSFSLPAAALAQDWWQLSDTVFAEEFAGMAFSPSLEDQSTVAWMLFARVNQQVTSGGQTVSTWETWPSNYDTFSPAAGAFTAANKVRTRPHLQTTKAARGVFHLDTPPAGGGEEVTRNDMAYDYIRQNGLYTKLGVSQYLSGGNAVDSPIGAVEIKADWDVGAIDGAYQFTDSSVDPAVTYSLVGLHIMAKMQPTPADPFASEDPSWFWTTFEFKGNEGLANAQSLITYPDALDPAEWGDLMDQAGLGGTAFMNYLSNGTQIRFADAAHPSIVLGNTKMEAFASVPANTPPQDWTAWNSSCHTCHGSASFNVTKGDFFPFDAQIGTGVLGNARMEGYQSVDFNWSIAFFAQ